MKSTEVVSLQIKEVSKLLKLNTDTNQTGISFSDVLKGIQLEMDNSMEKAMDYELNRKSDFALKEKIVSTDSSVEDSDKDNIRPEGILQDKVSADKPVKISEDTEVREEGNVNENKTEQSFKSADADKTAAETDKKENVSDCSRKKTEVKKSVEDKKKPVLTEEEIESVKEKVKQIKQVKSEEELNELLKQIASMLGISLDELKEEMQQQNLQIEEIVNLVKNKKDDSLDLMLKQLTYLIETVLADAEDSAGVVGNKVVSVKNTTEDTGNSEGTQIQRDVAGQSDISEDISLKDLSEKDNLKNKDSESLKKVIVKDESVEKGKKLVKETTVKAKETSVKKLYRYSKKNKHGIKTSREINIENRIRKNVQQQSVNEPAPAKENLEIKPELNMSKELNQLLSMEPGKMDQGLKPENISRDTLAKPRIMNINNTGNSSHTNNNSDFNFNNFLKDSVLSKANQSKSSNNSSFINNRSVDVQKTFNQLIKSLRYSISNGKSEMNIQLKPEFLGRLKIKLTNQDGHITAKFLADNPGVKHLIENNLNQLKQAFHEQNLNVSDFEVSVDQHDKGKEMSDTRKEKNRIKEADIKVETENGINPDLIQPGTVDREYSTVSYIA